jgi:hypothetical protein
MFNNTVGDLPGERSTLTAPSLSYS